MQVRAGTRRADANRRRPGRKSGTGLGLGRLALIAILLLTGLGVLAYAVSAGAVNRIGAFATERTVALSAHLGYRTKTILIEGRHYTDPDLLREIVGQDKNAPLMAFDPALTRGRLLKVSWIRDASVQRRLPDTIYIRLTERVPMALWQTGGKVSVIDETGTILTRNLKSATFKDLILVVGDGAETEAAGLLAQLEAEPALRSRIEAASWIGNRRWDIRLKSGLAIKLPEDNLGLALRQLARSQEQDRLLDKDIDLVDLREPDRFVIRTRPGAVQEYKAAFTPGGGDI